MFWNLVLEPGKKYTSTINEPFHLSMAALDVGTVKNPNDVYPVLLKYDGKDTVLCNLSKPQFLQVNLDHMFEKGSRVTFFTTGKATIHLTGYLLQDELDSSGFSDEDSSDDSDASEEEVSGNAGKGDSQKKNKRKLEALADEIAKKKPKSKGDEKGVDMSMNTLNHKSLDTSGDDEDDDDFDLSSDVETDDLMGGLADSDDSDDEDEEEDDDDDDDSDEDEDDSDEKNNAKIQKVQKTPQQTPKKKLDEKTPNQGKNLQKQQTPASNKKQNKQNQSLLNGAATPKSNKKENNKGTPEQKQGGTPQQKQSGTPQQKQGGTPQQKQGGTPQKRFLAGGVIAEDLQVGKGAAAKSGKTVSVYYTGRLKSNNRVFDQSNKGSGFKFRLGKGDVIKGWEVGISGMTVGSKRRLTIPPSMAYGKEGSGPNIPPNATLIFDVELRNVD